MTGLKSIHLRNNEDRNDCLKLLTLNNYVDNDAYLKTVIENSSHFLFYHKVETINAIVAFALVQVKREVLDIFLLCAEQQYASIMVYAIYKFALRKKCTTLYSSPRTAALRYTLMKYGFEHLRGIVDMDEVLVKHIRVSLFFWTDMTLKRKKYGFTKKVLEVKNFIH